MRSRRRALAGADAGAAAAALAGFARRRAALSAGRSQRAAARELYEDYAHHPTEVAGDAAGRAHAAPERLVAVFQPHLFSRTKLLAGEFGRALAEADVIAVLDVYPARERSEDFPGVSGLSVAEAAADAAAGGPSTGCPTAPRRATVLAGLLAAGDVCVLMGAGDVDRLAAELAVESGERAERTAGGSRARPAARAADDDPHRWPRRVVRAGGERRAAARAGGLGARAAGSS